ncbi:hypothetical protein AB1Y20_010383 [Prymnesium parvum]|uniref:O-fucosyltransferase family protein n=1 Tax=Prymnesium parvum TaxID=97485 RepID=A0AB34IRC9_PRYPA
MEELRLHLRWQREQLRLWRRGAPPPRFLVLRPGDKYTVCSSPPGHDDLRAHCYRHRGAVPAAPPAHWDESILSSRPRLTRPIPGLGNIALSLVSAAVAAVVSRRVLLVEKAAGLAAALGPPLDELLLETSGWAEAVAEAQRRGLALDGFAAHDDISAMEGLCADDLRLRPTARVWRIFSNQYFLPLLLLNPHHARQVERMALAAAGGKRAARRADASAAGGQVRLWGPALRTLLRPSEAVQRSLSAFLDEQTAGQPMVSMHVRAQLTGDANKLAAAAACARSRLRANNASLLFLATMHEQTRHALAAALPEVKVLWFGRAIGAQGSSRRATISAVSDLWLMGAAKEVMVTPGSTFGYVAHAISGGRATLYGGTHTSHDLIGATSDNDCREVPTSEAAFHFLKHARSRFESCRAGHRNASMRTTDLYRLSSVIH